MPTLYRIVSYLRRARIHYYTLHEVLDTEELAPESMANNFFRRMRQRPELKQELAIFAKVLQAFGDRCTSATREGLLHREDTAKALPPYSPFSWLGLADDEDEPLTDDIMLRLYCYPISERIILLFNGDYKTAQKVLDCPNVRPHFWFARAAADTMRKERSDWLTRGDELLPADYEVWL